MSTPILWLVVKNLGVGIYSTIIANLIGGSIFFWIDKFIFTSKAVEMWHFRERGYCDDCQKETSLWRLVLAPNYDRRQSEPRFFCIECSKRRTDALRDKGIKIRGRSR
ncbi:MAG: hypothetical protein ABIG46_01985 [Candidatus Omnitrophota bacterium]